MAATGNHEPFEYEGAVPGTTVWAQVNRLDDDSAQEGPTGRFAYVLRAGDASGEILAQGDGIRMILPTTFERVARFAFLILADDSPF